MLNLLKPENSIKNKKTVGSTSIESIKKQLQMAKKILQTKGDKI